MMEPFEALAYVSGRVFRLPWVLFEERAIGVADLWADVIYKLVMTVIALGTVFWGYHRFVRGKTYRRRLATSVSGTVRHDPSRPALYLFVTVGIGNVGFSRFEILKVATTFLPVPRTCGKDVRARRPRNGEDGAPNAACSQESRPGTGGKEQRWRTYQTTPPRRYTRRSSPSCRAGTHIPLTAARRRLYRRLFRRT
jgi:hypothetical protein